MQLLEGLNTEQREAVTHGSGPLFIIAGAGTGKTTVITRRIAHLIQERAVPSDHVLALTFTEKAAGEMEERVEALLPIGYVDLWVSTFHAFCERILKEHALDIGLSNDFRLLTETEQWLLLREHIDELELEYYKPKSNPTKFVQALVSHFSRLKDEDITPEQYIAHAEQLQSNLDSESLQRTRKKKGMTDEQKTAQDEAQRVNEVAHAYHHYQRLLRENNAMDFGDLIVETIHLFQQRPAVLKRYREQFQYILVDEFQDTNYAQYDLIKLLAAPDNNLTVVADDDQSIYSFRGASMSNILHFKKDYSTAREVSLIHNYRSPQKILDLAYEFIQHNNPYRLEATLHIDKRLRSTTTGEGLVKHLHATTADGEAKMVVDTIVELKREHAELSWNDCAILVRANAHAEQFIPFLERAGIPYQFLASQGLFRKPIVLDVIAFLQLLDNYHESRAMYRVLCYPVWKLAPEDLMTLIAHARKSTMSLYEACQQARTLTVLQPRTVETVERILTIIAQLSSRVRDQSVGEIILHFLDDSGYLKHITSQETRSATEQVLYLNQLYKYVRAFEQASTERTVQRFIHELKMMIDAGDDGRLQPDFEEGPESVKLLTVHAAKGLEFAYVFIANLVDKRFPGVGRSEAIPVPDALVNDVVPEGDWHLQEERRLFYVAMTRAKQGLYVTSAEDYGGARKKKLSRFLVETGFAETMPQPTGDVLFTVPPPLPAAQASAEVARLPRVFSYTQLKAYETCPWQYRFMFLLRVPVPGKPSYSFGKAMHATLYEFFRRLQERTVSSQQQLFRESSQPDAPSASAASVVMTQKELLDMYEQQWINEWFYSKKQREEYYKKGKEALKRFYELHHEQWPNVLYLEKEFHLKIGEYTIKGAIDRVDQSNDGVTVLDYKTGDFPKSGSRDMEQLSLYALALREVFQLDPQQLRYYYIESNRSIDASVDEEQLKKVREWALGLIQRILNADVTPTPGFHCQYCDYRDICEYRAK